MIRRLSLRARLILAVIALAAVGLLVADVVTYSSLSSFLVHRTNSTLDAAHVSVEGALRGRPGDGSGGGPDRGGDRGGPGRAPTVGDLAAAAPGNYIQLRRLDGTIVSSKAVPQFSGAQSVSPPRLPSSIALPQASTPSGDRIRYFTVPATSGGGRYQVRASIEPQARSYVLLIATSLSDVDSTLHRLLLIELLVTGLVVLAIGGLGLWVVRLGLRPLDAIGKTAAAIAAGDLSQRVERAEERTEVGRLGLALNAMLTQIEAAFHAREASEHKLRRFVADASHELRTPLAAVRAYAELFGRGAADRPKDLERSMKGISRESERMSLLVDDLLLLARLDEGRPLERKPVSLDDIVMEAVETAHTVEPDRPISVQLEPVEGLGDHDRLRQIVDNLLANVRAHTPKRTPVHVSVSRVDGMATIAVADEGPGMDEEQIEHAFERFYRADSSRARASGGVGLGLSIVSAVAAAHGGTAEAESPPGQGATFRIHLPLRPPAGDAAQPA